MYLTLADLFAILAEAFPMLPTVASIQDNKFVTDVNGTSVAVLSSINDDGDH